MDELTKIAKNMDDGSINAANYRKYVAACTAAKSLGFTHFIEEAAVIDDFSRLLMLSASRIILGLNCSGNHDRRGGMSSGDRMALYTAMMDDRLVAIDNAELLSNIIMYCVSMSVNGGLIHHIPYWLGLCSSPGSMTLTDKAIIAIGRHEERVRIVDMLMHPTDRATSTDRAPIVDQMTQHKLAIVTNNIDAIKRATAEGGVYTHVALCIFAASIGATWACTIASAKFPRDVRHAVALMAMRDVAVEPDNTFVSIGNAVVHEESIAAILPSIDLSTVQLNIAVPFVMATMMTGNMAIVDRYLTGENAETVKMVDHPFHPSYDGEGDGLYASVLHLHRLGIDVHDEHIIGLICYAPEDIIRDFMASRRIPRSVHIDVSKTIRLRGVLPNDVVRIIPRKGTIDIRALQDARYLHGRVPLPSDATCTDMIIVTTADM